MELGGRIAELRTANNMSQQALADALFVSRDLVSKWETGKSRPDYAAIERIAALFGVPADELADRNGLVFKELAECIPEGAELETGQLKAVTERFLESLSGNAAGIFVHRYYYLHSAEEIAGAFGLRANHVRSILSKTRVKFRKFIKKCAAQR